MIKLYDYQSKAMVQLLTRLKQYQVTYFMAQERFGKTHTALKTLEKLKVKSVAFITVKNAIKGIYGDYEGNYPFKLDCINYESLLKLEGKYDAVVFDESTKLSAFPKPSGNFKKAKDFIKAQKPEYVLWLNATPNVESYSQMYHQLQVVDFWEEKTFYKWHRTWGIPKQIRGAGGMLVNDYSKTHDEDIAVKIKHLFVKGTREQAGFKHHTTKIVAHDVKMPQSTKKIYDILKRDKVWNDVIADIPTKEMTKLQQLTGGFVYDEEKNTVEVECEKANYIINNSVGDKIAIYAKYTYEIEMLKKLLNATDDAYDFKTNDKRYLVKQIRSGSKGIDLSFCSQHWFYSLDFSGEVFIQAIARMHNKKREDEVVANIIVTEDCIDCDILDTVKNKDNFNTQVYRRIK